MLAVCICTPLPPSHSEMTPLPPEPHGPSSCTEKHKVYSPLLRGETLESIVFLVFIVAHFQSWLDLL